MFLFFLSSKDVLVGWLFVFGFGDMYWRGLVSTDNVRFFGFCRFVREVRFGGFWRMDVGGGRYFSLGIGGVRSGVSVIACACVIR